jgi:UDP-GlcNAc:undecaprenyl-phosphate GlcNAc-1-phosphate transferase
MGLVDHPDKHRKIHQKVTPVSGGLAVLVSVIATLTGALFLGDGISDALLEHGAVLAGLLIGALAICGLGVADDFGRLRGRHKLLGQLAAVGVVVGLGGWVQTVQIFGVHMELGWLGIPFTMFFMVGAINSLNLIDGMDGLLGSVGVILSLALAAMALLAGHLWAAAIALALAGALVGFLRSNLPPANIFLGDAGSMLVGLILGTLAIHCSLKSPAATIALAMPIALLIVPIFDTTAAIIRRTLTGRSIYTTDRGHLHHCLLRGGFSVRWVLVLVAICCLTACVGVLASQAFNNEWIALITAGSIIATLVVTRLFGHAEFMLIKGRLMQLFSSAGQASHLEVRLQGTAAWKDLWSALLERAGDLNLRQLLLDVNAPALHEGYHARWDGVVETSEGRSLWHVEIPMTARGLSVGRLVLAGLPDEQPVWEKIAILMKVVDEFNDTAPALPNDGGLGVRLWVPSSEVAKSIDSVAPATSAPHLDFGVETLQT